MDGGTGNDVLVAEDREYIRTLGSDGDDRIDGSAQFDFRAEGGKGHDEISGFGGEFVSSRRWQRERPARHWSGQWSYRAGQ